jgi:hypothetical protein
VAVATGDGDVEGMEGETVEATAAGTAAATRTLLCASVRQRSPNVPRPSRDDR